MPNFIPIPKGAPATPTTFNAPLAQLDSAIYGISTGDVELTSPDIQDYTYAQHDHTDAAGGGLLPFDALDASGATDGDVLQVSGGAVVAAPLLSGSPAGSVTMFAGSSAPTGWLLCYGQAVSRTTYAGLFAVVGTTYGVGDGSTTFNVPDMRGRTGAGLDNMGGSSANRITDTSADSIGGAMGEETHTLTISEMPNHNHGINVPLSGTIGVYFQFSAGSCRLGYTDIAMEGGGNAHNNVQPTLFFNFIIKI